MNRQSHRENKTNLCRLAELLQKKSQEHESRYEQNTKTIPVIHSRVLTLALLIAVSVGLLYWRHAKTLFLDITGSTYKKMRLR